MCSKILNWIWRQAVESWVIRHDRLLKMMIQLSGLRVLKYWLYSYKQKNRICKTLHAYLWSCIQGQIGKTDRWKLHSGTAQCSSSLCSILSLHKNWWCSVGAQLKEADAILSRAFLPIQAADGFIVGYLHSIAVGLSKMQDQNSLKLHWHSVDASFVTW